MSTETARRLFSFAVLLCMTVVLVTAAQALPLVFDIDYQPVGVHIKRLREALDYLGEPLSAEANKLLDEAAEAETDAHALKLVQEALDPLCLIDIQINPESRVKVQVGPVKRKLVQSGWSVFLVKVRNQAGVTAELEADSEQAKKVGEQTAAVGRDRWMELAMYGDRPVNKTLSGGWTRVPNHSSL